MSAPTEGADVETVRRIAHLARIEIDDRQAAALARDFDTILTHFRVLGELDLEDVEPLAGANGLCDVRRRDEPAPSLSADEFLAGAPAREGDFLRVPKTVGGES